MADQIGDERDAHREQVASAFVDLVKTRVEVPDVVVPAARGLGAAVTEGGQNPCSA